MLYNAPPHARYVQSIQHSRAILFKDLKTILDPEELHLIKIMLNT